MVTDGFGNVCASSHDPYINDCGYDAAGELLQAIHGILRPPVEPVGALLAFDQLEFMAGDADGHVRRGEAGIRRRRGAAVRR